MKFNRSTNQRKALRKTQLNALIVNGKITTTQAKAKEVKRLFDKLVSKAKVNSVHIRRQLAAYLSSTPSANRLVDVIAPLFPDRSSGFTTSAKEKIRKGDGVTMVSVKLLAELPKPVPVEKKTKPAPVSSRAKRSGVEGSKVKKEDK